MTVVCREFDESRDRSRHTALFRRAFPEQTGTSTDTQEHQRWKFRLFPAQPPSYEYVAESPELLAGYYAAIPYRYRAFGEDARVGMVCDVMTDPDVRGQGIFARLGAYATQGLADQGLAFTTGFPIRPEVIPGHLKVGWSIAFQLPMYVRPLRFKALLSETRAAALATPMTTALAAADLLLMRQVRARSVSFEDLTVFKTNEYTEFHKRWATGSKIALVKDQTFMEWRLSAPGTKYHILVARDADRQIEGIIVARAVLLRGVKTLAILDFMAINEDRHIARDLVLAAYRLAQDSSVDVIAAMMPAHLYHKFRLWRFGFIKSPAIFSFIIKPLNDAWRAMSDALQNPRNWRLMWIDSDDL